MDRDRELCTKAPSRLIILIAMHPLASLSVRTNKPNHVALLRPRGGASDAGTAAESVG